MDLRSLDIFKTRVLLDAVKDIETPPELLGINRFFPIKEVGKNVVGWVRMTYGRQLAPFTAPGGPARPATGTRSVGYQSVILPSIFLYEDISVQEIRDALDPEAMQDNPEQRIKALVAARLDHLRQQIDARLEWAVWQVLQNGGQITVSDNGVNFTVDFEVPSDHTSPVSTAWNADGADPKSDLDSLADKIKQSCGVRGKIVIAQLSTLQQMVEAVISNLSDSQKAVYEREGYIPNLWGYQFVPYDEVYEDADGTAYNYIDADKVIMLAPVRDLGITALGEEVIPDGDSFKRVVGYYSYSEIKKDAKVVRIYAGVNGLPLLRKPKAVGVLTGVIA